MFLSKTIENFHKGLYMRYLLCFIVFIKILTATVPGNEKD